MKSTTASRRFPGVAFSSRRLAVFSPRGLAAAQKAAPESRHPETEAESRDPQPACPQPAERVEWTAPAPGTRRITIAFDVPCAELAAHLNTCALLDIIHARRRRKLGSILSGALSRLVPHYATYSIHPASADPALTSEDRHAA